MASELADESENLDLFSYCGHIGCAKRRWAYEEKLWKQAEEIESLRRELDDARRVRSFTISVSALFRRRDRF